MVGQAQIVALLVALCAPGLGGLMAFWQPWLALGGAGCAWVASAVLLQWALQGVESSLQLGRWLAVGQLDIGLDLRVDLVAAMLLFGVCSVGLAAQLHAADYLGDQRGRTLRLCSLVLAGSTLLLIADNYPLFYAGWALLSAGGHLLAGADYGRGGAAVGRTWIALRLGDLALLAGLVALCAGGQLGWATGEGGAAWIGLCLLLAVCVRSAQFPFHFWWTGPREEISFAAWILHGVCAGTAGLYAMLRTQPIWSADALVVYAALGTGMVTALCGAISSLAARDVRPALSYAMVSQLGLALAVVALDGRGAALHLVILGMGMGLLFMGITCLARAVGDDWELGTVGRLRRLLPLPYWAVLLGGLTVAGAPPLAGVWSYGVLLAPLLSLGGPGLWAGGCLLVFAVALCAMRLVFMVAAAEEGEKPQAFRTPGGGAQTALIGLGLLALIACALGYPPGVGYLEVQGGVLRWELLIGPGVSGLVGVLVAWLAFGEQVVAEEHKPGALRRFFAEGFYAEEVLQGALARPLLALARWVRDLDTFLCELALIEFGALSLRGAGWILGRLQSGQVRFYAALTLLGIVAALFYLTDI